MSKLHADYATYVNACFQLDNAPSTIYVRLSCQIFLELADFERLGALFTRLLAEE